MLQSKILLFITAFFLSGCFSTISQLQNNQNSQLSEVSEKVDALILHSNRTDDMLVDLDLRMDTLEQDARKRGVPTRIKGSDLAKNSVPAPYSTNSGTTKNAVEAPTEQKNLAVQDMENQVAESRKISEEHYLPKGMTYGKKFDNEQSLNFPKDAETNQIANQSQNSPQQNNSKVGGLTGQNLTALNSPTQTPQVSGQLTSGLGQEALNPKKPSITKHSPPPSTYNFAMDLYKQKKYKEAEQAFDKFLAANPQGVLAPNALYWKGETYYARGDYPNAIFTFKEVQTRYPKHSKAADSLLKTGMSYAKLGDKNNANLHYTVLKEDFPNSDAAKKVPNI